ncbi:MAG: ATP-binding protein [Methanomicrobiales archaeon]|nr:ATP-binding protein [Methanomicrobiales archaeon]
MSGGDDEERGCQLYQFERNRYFYGKLMTVRDFEDEQEYLNRKKFLLNRGRLMGREREILQDSFSNSAERMAPYAERDRDILSWRQRAVLREIAIAVRAARARWQAGVYDAWSFSGRSSRGLGISVLFTGPRGTGKTVAAEWLAGDLNLPLYRIDLSSVVSKYIGETEKNIRRLFEAAEAGGAILFFDEADALFGKRSDVKDSHDRYACTEVHPLLHRIEAWEGLTLLSVRTEKILDPSCVSRIRYIIRFPKRE